MIDSMGNADAVGCKHVCEHDTAPNRLRDSGPLFSTEMRAIRGQFCASSASYRPLGRRFLANAPPGTSSIDTPKPSRAADPTLHPQRASSKAQLALASARRRPSGRIKLMQYRILEARRRRPSELPQHGAPHWRAALHERLAHPGALGGARQIHRARRPG